MPSWATGQKIRKIKFSWLKQMPHKKYGMAYCTDGKRIYCFGGGDKYNAFSNEVLIYHTQADAWINFYPDNFEKRKYGNCIYDESSDDIYLLTGASPFGHHPAYQQYLMPDIEVYDYDSQTFYKLDTNYHQAVNPGVVSDSNHLYIFGGSVSASYGQMEKEYTQAFHAYDIKTGKWQKLPDMPEGKEVKGAIVDNKLYTFGGYDNTSLNTIHCFDFSTNQWSKVGELPMPLSAYGIAKSGQYIFLVGDYHKLNILMVYDTDSGYIKQYKTNIKSRHLGVCILGNNLYVFGGNRAPNLINKGMAVLDISTLNLPQLNFNPNHPETNTELTSKD